MFHVWSAGSTLVHVCLFSPVPLRNHSPSPLVANCSRARQSDNTCTGAVSAPDPHTPPATFAAAAMFTELELGSSLVEEELGARLAQAWRELKHGLTCTQVPHTSRCYTRQLQGLWGQDWTSLSECVAHVDWLCLMSGWWWERSTLGWWAEVIGTGLKSSGIPCTHIHTHTYTCCTCITTAIIGYVAPI